MIKKIIFIIGVGLLTKSCGSSCEDVKNYSKSLNYYFKISQKSKDKFLEFKGYDKNNKYVEFKEAAYWKIYDSVEIGDTLCKELGKNELILIKKDTTLSFPLMCKGIIVE